MTDFMLQPFDGEFALQVAQEFGLQVDVAKILAQNSFTSLAQVGLFLNPCREDILDPFLLKDMDVAAERVANAVRNKQLICIYGDYDVDGSTASAILQSFFTAIGANSFFYIPSRLNEGYSLNEVALQKIKKRGAELLITVDNGILAHTHVLFANSLGLEVIVTDHHEPGKTLPEALAVINPKRKDCFYPFKGICGAGVAFKLVLAVRKVLRDSGFFKVQEPNVAYLLEYLAIGTVCDVVPLINENRFFVREGLKRLAITKRTGLKALLEVSDALIPSASDLGFRIGPRLNACGRLEEASLGVNLLLANQYDEALQKATQLTILNEERRQIEREMLLTALNLANFELQNSFVAFHESFHEGVVGIVASRLVEKTHKPGLVLARTSEGILKGSGRSVADINLVLALEMCGEFLEKFGGHEAAAGFTLKAGVLLHNFCEAFDTAINAQNKTVGQKIPYKISLKLNPQDLTLPFYRDLLKLEPHGMGNRRPLFLGQWGEIVQSRVLAEKHFKFFVPTEFGLVGGMAFNLADVFTRQPPKQIIYSVETNTFRGESKPQIVVRDFIA